MSSAKRSSLSIAKSRRLAKPFKASRYRAPAATIISSIRSPTRIITRSTGSFAALVPGYPSSIDHSHSRKQPTSYPNCNNALAPSSLLTGHATSHRGLRNSNELSSRSKLTGSRKPNGRNLRKESPPTVGQKPSAIGFASPRNPKSLNPKSLNPNSHRSAHC